MPQPRIAPLVGVPRRYDWGSPTAIPRLLGVEPDGTPVAELWFGAHPDDPSGIDGSDIALDAVIAEDADATLGAGVVERFGPRLPFLLKVLAADKALSMQVHPDLAQAQAGFAAEDAAGVARTAPHRNYRDANHKPELLCALTPFEALCGFRPVARTLALLDELALPELDFLAERLRGPDPLRAAFTAVLTHDDPAALVAAVAARATTEGPLRPVFVAAHDFPGDIGAVLTLLLNHVVLEPGEAIYLGAGNVHAYLRGTGVEIMASSDNVLRCGLTPKHVDVDELLRITDFRELAEPRWHDVGGTFSVPVPDFRLTRSTGRGEIAGPAIVLCIDGSVSVGPGEIVLPGRAAFVGAGAAVPMSVLGTAFVASVSPPSDR
ncbi:MAG TPA: mannose-6-phosphate isomerase, class I [Jatrophihabitans sp.]|jgi:mannose-6-phosphate isomerase|uniref:mannose-6-phosphate isomerase, class I n=1 Tax=Jatrophihabitans sp. TaxID=1932789 RepID=UPI002E07C7B8|nr:mannose-6-phosphate isomerase, class I [Jatrophihabitans sp.]